MGRGREMNRKLALLIGMALVSAAPLGANAGLLGATVNVDFYYPDQNTLYCSNGSAVVGAGVEYPGSCPGFDPVVIDISDGQITVDTGGNSWAGGTINGFLLT